MGCLLYRSLLPYSTFDVYSFFILFHGKKFKNKVKKIGRAEGANVSFVEVINRVQKYNVIYRQFY